MPRGSTATAPSAGTSASPSATRRRAPSGTPRSRNTPRSSNRCLHRDIVAGAPGTSRAPERSLSYRQRPPLPQSASHLLFHCDPPQLLLLRVDSLQQRRIGVAPLRRDGLRTPRLGQDKAVPHVPRLVHAGDMLYATWVHAARTARPSGSKGSTSIVPAQLASKTFALMHDLIMGNIDYYVIFNVTEMT